MSLSTPESVRKLQRALHAKAKGAPDYRFYALSDKVYRADVLAFAYRCCRANGGAPGVDGQRFEDIESSGLDQWLGELTDTLREKRYQPQPIRRTYIPKPDGTQRPLGIPTVRDRVVQTAARLVIEPVFEADLPDEQHAYRRDVPDSRAVAGVRHGRALYVCGADDARKNRRRTGRGRRQANGDAAGGPSAVSTFGRPSEAIFSRR